MDSSTVSLALRKDPRIRAETRERIEEAARRIGYMPNRIARSLSGGTTKVIGVMLTEMNRFFAGPLEALQNVGEDASYTISVHFSWWDRLREQQGMRQFCENCVEGVIWAPNAFDTSLRDTAQILRQANIPAIMLGLVHDDPQQTVPCHQIGIDMKAALRMGLEYLVKLGHRHIAVASAAGMSGRRGDMFRLRQRILSELFEEMRLEPLEENLYLTADHEYGGIEIAMALTRLERQQWPTAIFVAEDSLARGLARSLQALGVSVPGDISLLGYDVSSGEYADPVGLSTVSLESKEIASEAMTLLLDLIAKKIPAQPYRIVTSPAIIVERDSCGAPAGRSARTTPATRTKSATRTAGKRKQ